MADGVGTTHHISLGGHFYLLKPGSYQRRVAPQFGARFTTGDPDFNNLSFWQHWAQRCWVGGVDATEYADDAMYDDGIGVDTTEHEKVTLARSVLPGTGSNWSISAGETAASNGYQAIVYNSKLYVLTYPALNVEAKLWRYDQSTDGWTRITALDTRNITARSVAVFDGKLFIGGMDSVSGNPKVVYDDGALTSWTTVTNPSGVSQGVYAMQAFQQKLYVAYGRKVWRMKNDQTWDGNTVFYNVAQTSAGNYINGMETHLGFLYMTSQNGHIHRTDGNSTFDIWNWDGQTYCTGIKSFDGRLFILTFEFTETSSVGQGCLYQMSGSAVTQLKRWGDASQATLIGNLRVFDRKLFYGASNGLGMAGGARPVFGVACYDPIEDAHSIMACNADATTYSRGSTPYTNWIVDDHIFFGGQLFVFVRGHGAFRTPYQHRDRERGIRRYDTSANGASLDSTNGGWFTTSAYDAGTPGLKKLWRKVVIDCSLPSTATGIVVDYSTNNGASWTKLATISTASSEARARHEYAMDNVVSASLKLRITLRSTDGTKSPVLYGYVVSYVPVPEPQWLWTMTIVLSAQQELLDGTTDVVDTESELSYLSGLHRTKELVNFVDVDGTSWAAAGADGVLLYDMSAWLPDLTQPLEGEVQITLMEAVETY